jgi:primosomal protein N'
VVEKVSILQKKTCENLHTFIESLPLSVKVIGPAPSFREKQNDLYYWQLIIKSKKRDQLTAIIKQLPNQINYDIDPNNLL